MEQAQRFFVKFNPESLDILAISREDTGMSLPADWALVEPFFTLEKNPAQYYPVIENGSISGFRRRDIYESNVVINTDGDYVRSLRPAENTIVFAKLVLEKTLDEIVLRYDPLHLDRLELIQDRLYNIYITRRGDPYSILSSSTITLAPLLRDEPIRIPSVGHKDVSVYIIAANDFTN
jgi:hypothetical protein